jgi:signal transduction histidine kinase/CheY-like chemotaxis protein
MATDKPPLLPDRLRRRAEAQAANTPAPAQPPPAAADLEHELRVHQLELEMQNDELRRIQLELRASRDRYLHLYEFASVGYLSLDARGRVTEANLTAAALLRQERARLIGQPFAHLLALDARARWSSALRQLLAVGGGDCLELAMPAREGAPTHLQADCVRVDVDGGGHAIGATLTDTSERVRAAARQAQIELRLRESQKLEALGTLAGGIAHDFNNIVAAILGNVELARSEIGAGHAALARLDQVQKSARRARDIVQQILTFGRKQPPLLRVQSLGAVIDDVATLLHATLPASVSLCIELPAAPVYASADASQLQGALVNLCINAWQSLPGGAGRVTIGLGTSAPGGRADAAVAPTGPRAHLWLSDTGSGMDSAVVARVFEPFFTTKPPGQGTGLGLSAVHGVVTGHGGSIEVESEPGRGSCFHVYLPLAGAPEPADEPTTAPPDAPRGDGRHVLYVDDDPVMLLTVQALLSRAGYRVTASPGGREALAAVRADPADFDVVVTDFNMPGCTGLEVARELALLCPALPVIISSGYIDDQLRAQAQAAGVRGLMGKQNFLDELTGLIEGVSNFGAL